MSNRRGLPKYDDDPEWEKPPMTPCYYNVTDWVVAAMIAVVVLLVVVKTVIASFTA
jgi:hypothetical protein